MPRRIQLTPSHQPFWLFHMPPHVTVVIPCYNGAIYLPSAVESVLGQTRTDWELLIVDDGSTDDSASIAQRFADADIRIRAVSQTNSGVAGARNAGAQEASESSQHLLFLDADDTLEPTMLATLVAHIDHAPNAAIAHCGVTYIDTTGSEVALSVPRVQQRWAPTRFWMRQLAPDEVETPFVSILCGGVIVPSVALIRRAFYSRTGGWDETIGQPTEDTELFLELALLGHVEFLAEPLVRYRVHPLQSTVVDPEHFSRQVRALYARWSRFDHRPVHQQAVIRAAMNFKRATLRSPYRATQRSPRVAAPSAGPSRPNFGGGRAKHRALCASPTAGPDAPAARRPPASLVLSQPTATQAQLRDGAVLKRPRVEA